MKRLSYNVSDPEKRADVLLAELTGYTRSYVKKLCDEQRAFFNGNNVTASKIVKGTGELVLEVPDDVNIAVQPKDIPLDIVYEDDDVVVVNKPQGLTVHAGNGTGSDTLVNALLFRIKNLSGINGVIRPGIVHRIDKNTSGLLVVAKNDAAHLSLAKQLENKTCHRSYVALLEGVVKNESGKIETDIGRNVNDRTKMTVVKHGRKAVTFYKVIKRYDKYTLCRFDLLTGRTHQIRVHAKYMGHPIVGDKEYGYKNQKFKLNGQLLHAETLEFVHPTTGDKMCFTCPLPDYFDEVLKKLKIKDN